jgi:mono/diheme cytochrome c family protein
MIPHFPIFRSLAMRARKCISSAVCAAALLGIASAAGAGDPPAAAKAFLQRHCFECHDTETKKGDLDLTALPWNLQDEKTFARWVKVHDRVRDVEMPPKKKQRPAAGDLAAFLQNIAGPMIAADRARETHDGRATLRRLNRYEYENTLRDLFGAPWLQLKDMLPEDGESHRFNKIGDAMDVSHVQMARYLGAADYALRQVMASHAARPKTAVVRYYARDQRSFAGKIKFTQFNRSPERATFPMLGTTAQPEVIDGTAPISVGPRNPAVREKEALGVVASCYEPIEIRFDQFKAPVGGHYRIRLCAHSFWAGASEGKKWWTPDRNKTFPGRRNEPVTIYSETVPRLLRWLGAFDVTPEPGVHELEVDLLPGETIRPDAARLFRSRPPAWHNPLAEKDGQPGVAFRWLEVEGPIYQQWPTAGHRLLFGDLPLKDGPDQIEVISAAPRKDAERLLRGFLQRAYRHPANEADVSRFLSVISSALDTGSNFADAMIAGYSAVLCSPTFLYLKEKPGRLDDFALAERLSYFLWNSEPDEELRTLAARGELHRAEVLAAQTERMLASDKSRQFVSAFLDYWLDLRRMNATAPDATLYPDYYLDDLLVESATAETRMFFAELLRGNLPARNIVASDFAMLNERLAQHYGLPPIDGIALRRVKLPEGSLRGGLLTQASVLKVTANGTTTSPVLRGAWVMERILGKPPPKPPPSVPAIEPDTRGATTIREQLDKHRTQQSCSACHAKIDPAGFALESFDVMGGWRDRYRGLGESEHIPHVPGFGKNGQPFTFHAAQHVDASGNLPDGRAFQDIRELKRLLLADERQIARNLAEQLMTYATGAPIRFGDRPQIEQILDRAAMRKYGVRSLVREIAESEIFQCK